MPPIAGETQLQRAERLRRLSIELKEKARYVRVCDYLKHHPADLIEIEKQLIEDGKMESETAYTPAKATRRAKALEAEPLLMLEDGLQSEGGSGTTIAPVLLKYKLIAFDRNKTKYGDVSNAVAELILTDMHPITYSARNLTALIPRGKRQQNRSFLWEVIERNTGFSSDEPIPPSRRCDRHVAEDLLAAYKSRGEIGANLELPPDWDRDGPYSTKVVGDRCTITNKFNEASTSIAIPRNAEVYIDLAYSEKSAVLRIRNKDNFRHRISEVFANAWSEKSAAIVDANILCRDRNMRRRRIKSPAALGDSASVAIALRDRDKRSRDGDPTAMDDTSPLRKVLKTEALAVANYEGGSGGSGSHSHANGLGGSSSASSAACAPGLERDFKPVAPE
jgi:hypothetical protein